jgi:hypothetical protein
MTRLKLVFGLAVIVGMFAVSVVPASAWFKSLTAGATSGAASTGTVTFSDEASTIDCEKVEGAWQVRTTGKLAERVEGPGQQITKEGPHLDVMVSKWKGCTAYGFIGAEVKPCVLQMEQPNKGQTTGVTLSVATECTAVATGNCELKVAPEANEHLKTVTLENAGPNLVATFALTGVTSTSTPLGGLGCVGIKNGKNSIGTWKGTFKFEKQNEV